MSLCAAWVQRLLGTRRKWAPVPLQQNIATSNGSTSAPPLHVVIVGAGVGGSFAAMWLREVYGDRVKLTVISDGPVGGRCQLVEVPQQTASGATTSRQYECGAAIVSEMNEYMLDMMKQFDLKKHKSANVPMGIYDGTRFVFQEAFMTSGFQATIKTVWRVSRRYGLRGILRLKKKLKSPVTGLPDFKKLYTHLQAGGSWATPQELLRTLTVGFGDGCYDLTQKSAMSWFADPTQEVPTRLAEELAEGGMRSNYGGQGLDQLHGMVGLVSIAGGLASSCFKILGGNVQVPQGAMAAARATHVEGTARLVKPGAKQCTFEVFYDQSTGESMKGSPREGAEDVGKCSKLKADVVLIAHHLARSPLRIEGIAEPVEPKLAWGRMRRCCTHFLHGRLKPGYFGLESNDVSPAVLTIGGNTPFYSIGLQMPVDSSKKETKDILAGLLRGEKAVFKIFAPTVLTAEQLSQFFEYDSGSLKVTDWYAYPEYTVPQDLPPFVLADGLVYLNAVESVASAMEMSAVAARNAVNIVQGRHPCGIGVAEAP